MVVCAGAAVTSMSSHTHAPPTHNVSILSSPSLSGQDLLLLAVAPVLAASASLSIPGSACAIFLKSTLTLCPALADVSMNITLNSCAFCSASSVVTCLSLPISHRMLVSRGNGILYPGILGVCTYLLSLRSVLLPTSTMITSLPRSARTSSTHFDVFWNEARSIFPSRQFHASSLSLRLGPWPLTRNVVHHHRHRRVANVRRDQRSESFLHGQSDQTDISLLIIPSKQVRSGHLLVLRYPRAAA